MKMEKLALEEKIFEENEMRPQRILEKPWKYSSYMNQIHIFMFFIGVSQPNVWMIW